MSLRPGLGTWDASFHLRRTPERGFELRLQPADGGVEESCDLSELPEQIRQGIMEYLSRGLLAASGLRPDALERGLEMVAFSRVLRAPLPEQAVRLGEVALESALAEVLAPLACSPERPPAPGELQRLRSLVLAAREQGFRFDAAGTARVLTHLVTRQAEGLGAPVRGATVHGEGDDEEHLRSILRLLELAEELGLRPDLTRLQRTVFERLPPRGRGTPGTCCSGSPPVSGSTSSATGSPRGPPRRGVGRPGTAPRPRTPAAWPGGRPAA